MALILRTLTGAGPGCVLCSDHLDSFDEALLISTSPGPIVHEPAKTFSGDWRHVKGG